MMEKASDGRHISVPKYFRFELNVRLKYRYKNDTEELFANFNILALELLGDDLYKCWRISNRKLSPTTVINIASQMFEIIENLHKRNVIHRDIKPSNFLMGTDKSNMYV